MFSRLSLTHNRVYCYHRSHIIDENSFLKELQHSLSSFIANFGSHLFKYTFNICEKTWSFVFIFVLLRYDMVLILKLYFSRVANWLRK